MLRPQECVLPTAASQARKLTRNRRQYLGHQQLRLPSMMGVGHQHGLARQPNLDQVCSSHAVILLCGEALSAVIGDGASRGDML